MELTKEQKLRIGDIYERAMTLAETYNGKDHLQFNFTFDQYRHFFAVIYDTTGGSFKNLYDDQVYLVDRDGDVNEECFDCIDQAAEYCKQYFENQQARVQKSIEELERTLAYMRQTRDALAEANTVEA